MDKKFIWATTMNSEEGFAVAALDISGCVQLHSEQETVNKIIELVNIRKESHKKNFEAYNIALEMNTKLIVPDSVTYNYNKTRITSDSKRTLQAMYTQEKVDSQYVTFYDRRSVENIKKFRDMYKKKCDSIDSLIHILKTKGIESDLCRSLPLFTKFFPIEAYNSPLVKEPPISKDSPKKVVNTKKYIFTNLNEDELVFYDINELGRAVLEEIKDLLLLKYNSNEFNDISDIINKIANTSSDGDLLDTILNSLNAFKGISPLKVVVEDD